MAEKSKSYRGIVIVLMLLLAAFAAYLVGRNFTRPGSPGQPMPTGTKSPGETGGTALQDETPPPGLEINLSDGGAQPEEVQPLPVDPGEPLSLEEINTILLRLPPLATDPDDRQAFRLPEEVLPPPRTGETIPEIFPLPPEETAPEVLEGPLEVLRYSPEGDVPLAPFVNVTFNQPMAPLGTLEDLANEGVPVQMEPEVPGTWRWLGTKTLNFQFDSDEIDRLPMATEYTVTIPAGTTSSAGGRLAETVQFQFRTPPPTLLSSYPYSGEPQPLEPVFFLSFDQRVNPDEVLETITVEAEGDPVAIRLATQEEIEANEEVSKLVENASEGRWLAFQATNPLPKDSNISIEIGPGTPSAEGPRVTESSQSYSFRTYAPLAIVRHGCSWYDRDCPPLTPLTIEFNNPIETASFEESVLQVEPEIPGLNMNVFGNTINLQGATVGRTTYEITVSSEIEDIFGQSLGRDRHLTFEIGPAEPFLTGPQSPFVTLDPAFEQPVLSLYVMNYNRLDVKVYAVEPSDWDAFKTYLQEYQRTDRPPQPPGRLVRDEVLRIEAPSDKLTEVGLDLSEQLDGAFGHFIVNVKAPKGLFQEERYWEHVNVWVQVTQIGLDAFVDHSEMVAWTTSLLDGAPLEGLAIETAPGRQAAVTGPDGLARFPIPSGGATYLIASQGDDQAILPANTYMWDNGGWSARPMEDELRWYVIDDRQMYLPGEEVHLKGWIRRLGRAQDGDVSLAGNLVSEIRYQIYDPQGNDLGTGSAEVNALGGFDFSFSIPENANLGYAYVQMDADTGLDGRSYAHGFQIQEFRRPEFEVTARNETTGPYFVGDSATVAVEAKYYAGGPLPNAEVHWLVSSTPTNYNPPNWPDFTFGIWQPWWWFHSFPGDGETQYQDFSGTTDATGNHYLQMDFESNETLRPTSVVAEGTVTDVNRQAWAGSTSLLVHPGELYVGMRSERYFVERGQPLKIELIVTDLDGNAVPGRQIETTAARLEWKFEDGEWVETEADVQECNIESADEPVTCVFETPVGGRYQITAIMTDDAGRGNKSQFTRWVSGGELPPARNVEQEEATLIPDKESYQPGDVAEILVQSPFSPAEGLLTVSRSGILYTEAFLIEEGSITLEIPIEEAHIPNLNVQVDLVGSAPRTDDQGEPLPGIPERPAFATGSLNLSIPPLGRTLALEVDPEESQLEPGAETTVHVTLKDSAGRPIPDAELAAIVVDEAILALTNYQLADPIAVFYTNRPSDVWSAYSRASIILADPNLFVNATPQAQATMTLERGGGEAEEAYQAMAEAPAAEPAAAEADMAKGIGGEGAQSDPITVRSNFNPLATFAPEVRTDANGEASIRVKLPDNLTRYRIMVVAVDGGGNRFGSAEASLTARLPLMVRPSAPRFLNFGDSLELPVVLQNQTDEALTVDVAIETTNTRLTGDSGLRVDVPANDRIEVRFPATTDRAGTARFQVAAVSGEFVDAASVALPVYTPATTEAFATYGVIDEGSIVQPVSEPTDVFPQFGGLELQTSSTALQSLTDAVIYLVSYPFEGAEQMASRVLGIAALRDVLSAFEAEGLSESAEMEAAVRRDIERLQGLQNFDGGFPYWRRGQDSIPFITIHVAHALQRAEFKGFDVPQNMQDQLLPHLQNIESYYPHWYSQRTRWTLSAYALYVRDLMGDHDPAKARQLLDDATLEGIPLEAVGWIWQVLVEDPNSETELEAIRRYVANRAVETAGAANFIVDFHDQTYLTLSSNRRADAILLDALIADNPDNDLIPKLVNGLLAHRVKGHWGNTQENVFVLLALDRYFNTYEAQTPDFVARIWLGETYAAEHAYQGRTTERHETLVPMEYLVDPEQSRPEPEMQNLVIQKDGAGRLYYRLGLKYAPTDLWLDPLDMGFVVLREYEGVDDPENVYRDEEGIWHIKAGARVKVKLTMVADSRRYHVALVDPLPAGLEIVNPDLAVSQSLPQDPDSPDFEYGWWWWWTWYEHQNMRDERAEAFASLLWDGVYEYTYIARATTPGKFVVPPAKAEEMYSPEVFGRSGSDWVIVE